jgi:hypothetical protein
LLAGYLTVESQRARAAGEASSAGSRRHRRGAYGRRADGGLAEGRCNARRDMAMGHGRDEGVLRAWIARSLTVMLRVMAGDDGNTRAEIRIPYEVEDESPEPKRPTLH